jgi:broad specificity phosphatase PhoE
MTRLILIRHGETDWNVEGRYQGQADPPLNARGLAQARELAEALRGVTLDVRP